MKVYLFFILSFFALNTILSQEGDNKFRVDYNYVSSYESNVGKWTNWEKGDNTFIINLNERGDIAHLMASGETVIYKKISNIEEDWTDDGEHYQILKMIDENGDVFNFQIFDDRSIGLKLIWKDFMFQFAKF